MNILYEVLPRDNLQLEIEGEELAPLSHAATPTSSPRGRSGRKYSVATTVSICDFCLDTGGGGLISSKWQGHNDSSE